MSDSMDWTIDKVILNPKLALEALKEVEELRRERDECAAEALKQAQLAEASDYRLEATEDRLRQAKEALRGAQERFAQIDCAQINSVNITSQSDLLDHCKALASRGFDETSKALRVAAPQQVIPGIEF